MFDTSLVRARAIAAPRSATLGVSIAIHSIVIVAAVAMTVTSTQVPADPPRQLELYRPVELPSVPPPPLGVRPSPQRPAATPLQQPPAHIEQMAPPTIPDEVHVVLPSTGAAILLAPAATDTTGGGGPLGDPNGDRNGVPGGQAGGSGSGVVAAHGPYTPGVGGVTLPRVVKRVEPRFPELMRHAVSDTTVVVRCVIGSDGEIHDPRIVTSSFPPFNDSVLEALRQWRFSPGMMDGRPVDTYFQLTVRFEVRR